MIDLHTHSLLSDGVYLPSELARRAEEKGYEVLAITDHVDFSNIDLVAPKIIEACGKINKSSKIKVVPGVEITHVHPKLIPELVKKAKKFGKILILVHGETIVEPVLPGTNRSALESGIDILTHPGLITKEDALLAKEKSVCLEISARKGHSLTNGHVAKIAGEVGADFLLSTDAHEGSDLISDELARKIALGAGLQGKQISKMFNRSKKIVERFV